jgi:hypothetical protein
MASPPAIALECRDGGAWRAVVAALQGLAAAVLLAWAFTPWAAPAGMLVALFGWRLAERDAQRLAWDGRAWTLDGAPVRPVIVLDPGVWMLLAFDTIADSGSSGATPTPGLSGHKRRRWAALSPAAGLAAWPAMRAALYFSSSSRAERPAEPVLESRAP